MIKNVVTMSFLLILIACGSNKSNISKPKTSVPKFTEKELTVKGEKVYNNNCTVCHNKDPKKAGNIGPELNLSRMDVVDSKVLKGTYPENYTPIRDTKMMPVFSHLSEDMEALKKYLESLKE